MAKKDTNAKTTLRTLHYFWQMIKKYKWMSLGTFLITPVVIFIRSALIPLTFSNMIGTISSGLSGEELVAALLPQGISLTVTYIISSLILERLRLFFCWRMEIRAMYDLATQCFNTVSAQSMQFHSNRFSGSLVSQSNKFTGAFERFCDVILWDLLPLVSTIVFIVIILYPKAPLFTCILMALVAVYTIISGSVFKRMAHLNEVEASAYSRVTGQLADSISNIISVKSYAGEPHERRRYANFNRAWYNASNNVMIASIKRDFMFSAVNMGIVIALVIFMMYGSTVFGLSVSTLVLIVNYSQQIMGNLWDINHIFKNLNRAFGDAREMTVILDTVDDVVDLPGAKKLTVDNGSVLFNDITFCHAGAKEAIFQNFSLEIKPGERVGLVGISGSGKTTLTRLLLRFADVNSGEILVDGQNIQKVLQSSLRENIAYVPQETSLFHRTISENIAYARPNATKEEIERAAKLANADDFIRELPEGYDTLVGERGVKLSGGQRQRIAIARAILKDAPILVLDEATSALDSESEALIQDALEKLMKGRTSIVIAHRLSTVADLDRIIVLENGKIVEQGTHQELLKASGSYHHLWSRQSGAFLE